MSLRIKLQQVAKRYRREWVIRQADLELHTGQGYALRGPNGSGKSTFLRLLSGLVSPSRGKIEYFQDEQPLPVDQVYRYLAMAAPYQSVIELYTLPELIQFQAQFRPFTSGLTPNMVEEKIGLTKIKNKRIRDYSSGMRQRVQLGLAIMSDAPLLLLDEPTTNLDQAGVDWYRALVEEFNGNRLLVIASNDERDFVGCGEGLEMAGFK